MFCLDLFATSCYKAEILQELVQAETLISAEHSRYFIDFLLLIFGYSYILNISKGVYCHERKKMLASFLSNTQIPSELHNHFFFYMKIEKPPFHIIQRRRRL